MDLTESPVQAEYRARLRSWLEERAPFPNLPHDIEERFPVVANWQRELFEAGYAGVSWPKEVGGQGLGPLEEAIVSEELGRAGAPPPFPLGYLGRPVLMFGTPEQAQSFLPPMLAGEDIWCQGFSEPEAGSDLASLRTRAVRDGDVYRVTGQKVWTSYAQFADHCLTLVRTNPEDRHGGISCLVIDMKSPGVTVRPMTMATGEEEFSEVFFDDVEVPVSARIADEGAGWSIALSTLTFERGAVDIGYQAKFTAYLAELEAELDQLGVRQQPTSITGIGEIRMLLGVLRLHCLRTLSARAAGIDPGPTSSVDKLLMTEVEQRLTTTADELTGAIVGRTSPWFDRYLYGRAGSIYGGTSEIQRTVIARQVLALDGH